MATGQHHECPSDGSYVCVPTAAADTGPPAWAKGMAILVAASGVVAGAVAAVRSK